MKGCILSYQELRLSKGRYDETFAGEDGRVVVSYKRKNVHKVLVNRLVKLAEEKSVARWTDRPDITIAVDWDVKQQTKPETIMKPTCTDTLMKP